MATIANSHLWDALSKYDDEIRKVFWTKIADDKWYGFGTESIYEVKEVDPLRDAINKAIEELRR